MHVHGIARTCVGGVINKESSLLVRRIYPQATSLLGLTRLRGVIPRLRFLDRHSGSLPRGNGDQRRRGIAVLISRLTNLVPIVPADGTDTGISIKRARMIGLVSQRDREITGPGRSALSLQGRCDIRCVAPIVTPRRRSTRRIVRCRVVRF